MTTEATNLFEIALADLKALLGETEVTPTTIVVVLRFAMEIVESTKLKGLSQKKLCLRLVRAVVEEAPINAEKKKLLLDLVNLGILENAVDLVVEASKGQLNINMVIKVSKGCCKSFMSRTGSGHR